MAGRPASTYPTMAEIEVLTILTARGTATVRDIKDDLDATGQRKLAYTSLATITRIMVDKKLVEIVDARRPQRFKPSDSSPATSTQPSRRCRGSKRRRNPPRERRGGLSVETKPTMKLLPPPEGHCRICAVKHEPHMPHNAQSLFYGMRFIMRYGRDGTWADAIAHCTSEMQEYWRSALSAKGVWTQPPTGVETISEPIDG